MASKAAAAAAAAASSKYGPLWGRGYETLSNRRILSVSGTFDHATSYLQGLVIEDFLSAGTKSMTVGGRAFKILNQTEEHLIVNYGKGWENPDPKFKMEKADIYGGPISKKDMGGKYTYNFKTGKYKVE